MHHRSAKFYFWLISGAIIVSFTGLYLLLVLHKYWQLEYFYPDNYFFSHALWQVAQGKTPIVFHQMLGEINILGDHFHPVIFFMSLLLAVFGRQEVVLITMCVLYGLSAVFAVLVADKLIQRKYVIWGLLIAYFLYLGTQNAMIYGFHEINFMPLFFFMTLYGWYYDKKIIFWSSFALLLLTKESIAIVTVSLAVFFWLAYPQRRKTALTMIILSIGYFFIISRFVIPYFNGGQFLYSTIDKPPRNLPEVWQKLVDPPEKIQTFWVSMLTFGLLPLANIFTLLLVLQDFLVRYFLAIPGNVQYTLGFHYGVALAPILFFSSVFSFHQLEHFKKFTKLITPLSLLFTIGLMVINLYFNRFYSLKGPLVSTFIPDFYKGTSNNAFMWQLIKHVPTDGSIMTMNHLGYIFARQKAVLFNKDMCTVRRIQPDYIVFDLREGQNPNNYFPVGQADFANLTKTLLARPHEYAITYQQGDQYILKRKIPLTQCDKYGKYE